MKFTILTTFKCTFHVIKYIHRDFPSGPVVKTLPSKAGGRGLIPDQGTKTPRAAGAAKIFFKKEGGSIFTMLYNHHNYFQIFFITQNRNSITQ